MKAKPKRTVRQPSAKPANGEVHKEAKKTLQAWVGKRTRELMAVNTALKNEIVLRKRLEGELLEVADREQSRLGQDLHDGLCQHLAAVAFMAQAKATQLGKRKVDPSELREIADLINEGVTEARNIARGLHPVELDSAGLMSALQRLATQKRKIPCRLTGNSRVLIRDQAVALHLYRIAREAVINANKHSGGREVVVSMDRDKRGIVMSVIDDGIGVRSKLANSPGMGFNIMRYRSRTIGATLTIRKLPHGGTEVQCVLPQK